MSENESTNVEVPPPAALVPQVEWTWYIVGLVGFALGAGFYGILSCILLVAWALHAPNAPTGAEGAAILGAALVHIVPMVLWLCSRPTIIKQPISAQRVFAIAAWLLIPTSLTVMFAMLGFE